MEINLTKRPEQYDSDERRALWISLVKEARRSISAKNNGWLTGGQRAAARGMATRAMLKAGF